MRKQGNSCKKYVVHLYFLIHPYPFLFLISHSLFLILYLSLYFLLKTEVMLTEKETRILKTYEKQLAMSKWKYFFFYGVFLWGITVLIITILTEQFIFNKDLQVQWNEGLLGKIIIMPAVGIFFGWFMRKITTRRYRQLKDKEIKT